MKMKSFWTCRKKVFGHKFIEIKLFHLFNNWMVFFLEWKRNQDYYGLYFKIGILGLTFYLKFNDDRRKEINTNTSDYT